jgi:hypothetical protein
MADGRMLSKRVTRSNKIADLSSDTARMIYSWLIPYTDVEGRMEADPRLLKADIAPLLDHITSAVINNVLLELHKIGLIVLYSSDDGLKKYLQILKFEENQKNLRKDREAPSHIPGPTPAKVRQNSGEGPDLLPPKIKLSLREAEGGVGETEAQNDPPVDNSKDAPLKTEPKEPDALLFELRGLMEDISKKMPDVRKQRQVILFVEANIQKNHNAVLHCIKSFHKQLQNGIAIEAPKQYLEAALKIEEGKHNARDHEARAEKYKAPPTQQGLAAMKQIFAGMGGVAP